MTRGSSRADTTGKPAFGRPALQVVGIALLLAAVFLLVWSARPEVPPAPRGAPKDTAPRPVLALDESSLDFGSISQEQTVTHTIRFRNRGSGELEILDVDSS